MGARAGQAALRAGDGRRRCRRRQVAARRRVPTGCRGDRRATWPLTLRLDPLDDDDVEELIPKRIAGKLRERIALTAGGNPLFIEEMLAMAEEAEGEVIVPPTLQALLGARLDQLETAERSVLERGAIEGQSFHRGAVQAL